MNKNILITGATSGIGYATAVELAQLQYNLIITGRRTQRLQNLKEELEAQYGIKVLALTFDVRNKEEVETALENLPDAFAPIDGLINNAGLAAGLDFFHEGDTNDWDTMIDTNVKGLLYVAKIVSQKMVARKQGHIINISSIAGKQSYDKGGVYCATKHAVEAITKNMRIDLLPHGIKVSSVSPGAVKTEFSEVRLKSKEKAKDVYNGYTPLEAKDIAESIVFILTRPPHVNINDILIMPTAQADAFHTHKN
ncbi:MAG: SDR family NAD(P)-dependent oxidoreductase [Bacteroidota bacterium]|nr:SDR family NAD(P)-dependent oxidoreductase [Bacteroidota bacterium]